MKKILEALGLPKGTSEVDMVRVIENLLVRVGSAQATEETLRQLLAQAEKNTERIKQIITQNGSELVMLYLDKLGKTKLSFEQRILLFVAMKNLADILSPFVVNLTTIEANLTPREIEVARLVRDGFPTKKIAEMLKISRRAVEFHRDGVRRKLGLQGTRKNLRSHLINMGK